MPMDQRLDQLASVQLVVVVGIVHFEVVELQFLFAHFARINRHVHMLSNVPVDEESDTFNEGL